MDLEKLNHLKSGKETDTPTQVTSQTLETRQPAPLPLKHTHTHAQSQFLTHH